MRQISQIFGQTGFAEYAAESRIIAAADFEAALESFAHAALAAQPVTGTDQTAGTAAAGLDMVHQRLLGGRQWRVGSSFIFRLTQEVSQDFDVLLDEILLLSGLGFADWAGQGENAVNDIQITIIVQRDLMASPSRVDLLPERNLGLEFRGCWKFGVRGRRERRKFGGRWCRLRGSF